MNETYRERNDLARARLAALFERLSPEDLERPLSEGWTVKAALTHLAFWDRFATATVQRWQRAGFTPSDDDGRNIDDGMNINVAALPDWLAAPQDYVLREVMRAAAVVDATVASVDQSLLSQIAAGGETWAYERGRHRGEHIEQIERCLDNLLGSAKTSQ